MPDAFTSTTGCSLAETAADRDQVYRLRYQCYRRGSSIPETGSGRFPDEFDELPNSFSFLVRSRDHEPLATVRINIVSPARGWHDAPVRHVYGDHPTLHAIAGESFVEANRLCFSQQARRDAFAGLVGHMAAMADIFEAPWMVACPRVEHAKTYQHMFGFRAMAEPRQYFGVAFATQLLAIRRHELRQHVSKAKSLREAWHRARCYLGAHFEARTTAA